MIIDSKGNSPRYWIQSTKITIPHINPPKITTITRIKFETPASKITPQRQFANGEKLSAYKKSLF